MPKHVKDQLNESVQKKREADAIVNAFPVAETKEMIKPAMQTPTPDAAAAQLNVPAKKGPPPAASSVSILKPKAAVTNTPSPAPAKREVVKVR